MKRFYWLSTLAILVSILPAQVSGTPPGAPLTQELALSDTPKVGRTVELTLTITAQSNLDSIATRLHIPVGFQASGPLEWNGAMTKGQVQTLTTGVQALREGYWKIEANTTYGPGATTASILYLSTYTNEERADREWSRIVPTVDLFGDFNVQGEPKLNNSVDITYTLTSSDPILLRSSNTTIRPFARFPAQSAELLNGETSWTGKLLPGQTAKLQFTIRLIELASFPIQMENFATFDFIGSDSVEPHPAPGYYVAVRFYVGTDSGRWEIDRRPPFASPTTPVSFPPQLVIVAAGIIGAIGAASLILWKGISLIGFVRATHPSVQGRSGYVWIYRY